MKWLLVALLTLVVSVSVALFALPDPGYVMLAYGKYSMETSLLVFAVAVGLVFLVLSLLAGLWKVPGRVQRWEHKRRSRKLRSLFNQATIELAEGDSERAERRLARLARSSEMPLAVCLAAARAADQLNAADRRDQYLRLAVERNPDARVAIGLVQAELQLARGQLDQAQTTLTGLYSGDPHNAQLLRLLMNLYIKQQDWKKLRELLPELRRRSILEADQWQQLAIKVYREQAMGLTEANDLDSLQDGWKHLPAPVQRDQGLLLVYLEQLMRLGAHRQAEQLIVGRLKDCWDEAAVYVFGNLTEVDAATQQKIAESWLSEHPQDPALLLTLGKISLRNQLWGKARNYLESSIGQRPTAEAYRLLGSLLEQLDEPQQAAECYRKGIELVDTPLLPATLHGQGVESIPTISRSA